MRDKIPKKANTVAMKVVRRLLLGVLALFLIAVVVFFGYYFTVTRGEKLHPEKLNFSARNVILYDDSNQTVDCYSTGGTNLTAPIENIPKKTQLAFVDTEDKRFFKHNGFDLSNQKKYGYTGQAALNHWNELPVKRHPGNPLEFPLYPLVLRKLWSTEDF